VHVQLVRVTQNRVEDVDEVRIEFSQSIDHGRDCFEGFRRRDVAWEEGMFGKGSVCQEEE
jgi:hypothetical protein